MPDARLPVPVLTVTCPRCGAAPGSRCTGVPGAGRPGSALHHPERVAAADHPATPAAAPPVPDVGDWLDSAAKHAARAADALARVLDDVETATDEGAAVVRDGGRPGLCYWRAVAAARAVVEAADLAVRAARAAKDASREWDAFDDARPVAPRETP